MAIPTGAPLDGVYPLPMLPASVIGRDRETHELAQYLREGAGRLVTLTGPGGVGKTTLALEVTQLLQPYFPGGAVFVPLAALTDAGLVASTVMTALGMPEQTKLPPLETLRMRLRDQHALLVLDNFEHLLPAAPDVAGLLASCPELRVLATSRAPLRIRGELEYPVTPLELPEPRPATTRDEIASVDAVRLFVERAQASSPTFALTPANAASVAAICRRLDGLPLALELAATRMRFLSPNELLARLDPSLPLLTGGARDLPARQQTMRQAIAWGYNLLDTAEQRLFRWLSVFRGGWYAVAAEEIANYPESGDTSILEILSTLVEHALVVAATTPESTTRFRMLETIREFGQDELETSGEAAAVEDAHTAWCMALIERAREGYFTPAEPAWFDQLEVEHANLRAALERASRRGDHDGLLHLLAGLGRFWYKREHFNEGRAWLERATGIARDAEPSPDVAWVFDGAASLAWAQGDLARSTQLLRESLAVWRALGDEHGAARAAVALADIVRRHQDVNEADALLDAALLLLERQGAGWFWVSTALRLQGLLALERGETQQAESLLTSALDAARTGGHPWPIGAALHDLGRTAHLRGDHLRAIGHYRESIDISWAQRERWSVALAFQALAGVFSSAGLSEQAVRLYGAAATLGDAITSWIGATKPVVESSEQALSILRHQLGDAAFDAALAAGRSMTLEQAIAEVAAVQFPEPEAPGSDVLAYPGGLSHREVEVVRLVVAGLSNRDVADRLYISRRTVDAHLRRIYDKLDLGSRAEMIRFAIEHGIA